MTHDPTDAGTGTEPYARSALALASLSVSVLPSDVYDATLARLAKYALSTDDVASAHAAFVVSNGPNARELPESVYAEVNWLHPPVPLASPWSSSREASVPGGTSASAEPLDC